MKHNYIFEFGRVTLLPLEETDIEQLRVLRNKERQYFNSTKIITGEEQKNWYLTYLNRDDDIMFKVVRTGNEEEFIGAIAVYAINYKDATAEVGRTVIDKLKAPEKGIGMDATKAVCLFAFDVLKIKKIVATVLKNNERIIKVDTRAGFYVVGDADEESYAIEMTRDSLRLD